MIEHVDLTVDSEDDISSVEIIPTNKRTREQEKMQRREQSRPEAATHPKTAPQPMNNRATLQHGNAAGRPSTTGPPGGQTHPSAEGSSLPQPQGARPDAAAQSTDGSSDEMPNRPNADAAASGSPRSDPASGDSDSESVEVVHETGQIANRDLPHMRHDCAVHRFQKLAAGAEAGSPANSACCSQCYCYVCDVKASECEFWGTGARLQDHANASSISKWTRLRQAARVATSKRDVLKAAFDGPLDNTPALPPAAQRLPPPPPPPQSAAGGVPAVMRPLGGPAVSRRALPPGAHWRPDCPNHVFESGVPSWANWSYCSQCICYRCGVRARDCRSWGSGLSATDHANARDESAPVAAAGGPQRPQQSAASEPTPERTAQAQANRPTPPQTMPHPQPPQQPPQPYQQPYQQPLAAQGAMPFPHGMQYPQPYPQLYPQAYMLLPAAWPPQQPSPPSPAPQQPQLQQLQQDQQHQQMQLNMPPIFQDWSGWAQWPHQAPFGAMPLPLQQQQQQQMFPQTWTQEAPQPAPPPVPPPPCPPFCMPTHGT